MPFYEEPQIPEALTYVIPKGKGYYTLTRHAHISEASRHPEIFQSGRGATSIIDMPEEMLDFFGSMINMDNPVTRASAGSSPPRSIPHDQIDRGSYRAGGRRGHRPGSPPGRVRLRRRGGGPAPARDHLRHDGHPAADYDTVFHASNVILSSGDSEYGPRGGPDGGLHDAAQQLNLLMTDLATYRRGIRPRTSLPLWSTRTSTARR